jgi:hypothetical protein
MGSFGIPSSEPDRLAFPDLGGQIDYFFGRGL